MNSLESLQKKLDETFGSLKFDRNPAELYEPLNYTLTLGGKRIRPMLVLIGCDLAEGDPDRALPAAIGIELFHNFTLLHDDIMDRSPLRRGNETVYKKWNSNIAILSGDTLFALAFESMLKADPASHPGLLELFTETAIRVCEGQQYDMNFESKDNVTIEEYLGMIRLKTAVLLACSLQSGAIIAGASPEICRSLYSTGENLGMAFQLQDDLLDVYGNEERFGKEIGRDIIENKKTFLYLKALQQAGPGDKYALEKYFQDEPVNPEEKIKGVKRIYDRLQIREITVNQIGEYFQLANSLITNLGVPNERKHNLQVFSDRLVSREY